MDVRTGDRAADTERKVDSLVIKYLQLKDIQGKKRDGGCRESAEKKTK